MLLQIIKMGDERYFELDLSCEVKTMDAINPLKLDRKLACGQTRRDVSISVYDFFQRMMVILFGFIICSLFLYVTLLICETRQLDDGTKDTSEVNATKLVPNSAIRAQYNDEQ